MDSVKNTQVNREEARSLMDAKIKKIIAREGLVIIGFIVAMLILMFIFTINPRFLYGWGLDGVEYVIVLFGYPVYLIICFIVWAIRTLKK